MVSPRAQGPGQGPAEGGTLRTEAGSGPVSGQVVSQQAAGHRPVLSPEVPVLCFHKAPGDSSVHPSLRTGGPEMTHSGPSHSSSSLRLPPHPHLSFPTHPMGEEALAPEF